MSTTLFFLVPIGMLAVVWSVCFVGCHFPTGGLATPYSYNILQESTLVAYWPLSDAQGSTSAADLSGHGHTGTYTHPPAYPADTVATFTSLAIPNPTRMQQQQSIVSGDVGEENGVQNPNTNPSCVDFDGDYVSIPWSAQTPTDLTQFTFEAWIQPGWSASDPPASYIVFDTRTPDFTGFGVFVDNNNNWEVSIGNGSVFTQFSSNQQVVFDSPTYIAVTCDSTGTVNFWINPPGDTATAVVPGTNYAKVDQSQSLAFFIGAGISFQPLRTTDNGTGSPLFAFNGQIQDVALYNSVLGGTDIQSHFSNGSAP
jgi:Concanavalin A-like lectin/glucanases superfamily